MADKPSVLFVCVHNAGRSQMAAGFLSQLSGGAVEVRSAGSLPGDRVNPSAVAAMAEVGIDISGQRSRSVDELDGVFDVCVTVCDANCPIPPRSGLKLRWSFPDPALAGGDDDQRLVAFRVVRDGIEKRVKALATRLG